MLLHVEGIPEYGQEADEDEDEVEYIELVDPGRWVLRRVSAKAGSAAMGASNPQAR
jgi:hypothetical protein